MRSNRMMASVHRRYGPPEVLQLKEVAKPMPKDNEVLVRVHAATVNRTDCATLRAIPFFMRLVTGLVKPKNKILGSEFAGEIVAIGNAVTSFKVGDRIFGLDDGGLSSHAQYLTISENAAIAIIPNDLTYAQAAASTEGGHYAYNFMNKVPTVKGRKVLVNGATGAIGSALVQLLKHFGAEITAVANTKNLELVCALGATHVIDYMKEDFTKEDQQYDFVFDAVGKSTFGKCRPLLPNGGVYISSELGPWWQNLFYALWTPRFSKKKVLFPYPEDAKESVLLIRELIEAGQFNSVIDRSYSLEHIQEAFRYVETSQKTGNVVINIEHS